MGKTPFKMKGFSGFGNSPVRYGVSGEGVIDPESAKLDLASDAATPNATTTNGDGGGDGDKKGGGAGQLLAVVGNALADSMKSDRAPTTEADPNENFKNIKIGV